MLRGRLPIDHLPRCRDRRLRPPFRRLRVEGLKVRAERDNRVALTQCIQWGMKVGPADRSLERAHRRVIFGASGVERPGSRQDL